MPSRAIVDRVVAAHLAQQTRVRDLVALQLALLLEQLPALDDPSRDLYVAAAVPVVATGQRRAAELAAGFARAVAPRLDERPAALDVDRILVTGETAWLGSPILVARRQLADGGSFADAITLAASKARGYATGDLQVAARYGLERGAAATGARVRGYRKSLAGDACPWCRDVSGRLYRQASSVPFHEHDACSVEPVYD